MGVVSLNLLYNQVFTARKRSFRRLCFYTCLSVILSRGLCPSACWDAHTAPHPTPPGPEADPPPPDQRQTPSQNQKQTPLWDQRQTSPRSSACWEILATSGWYTSYWNAFLFSYIFTFFVSYRKATRYISEQMI